MSATDSRQIGPMIADSARLGLAYARRMLDGIAPEQFARLAVVEGRTIQSNHPAFIYGHLSLYPARIVSELGGDASAIAPSDEYVNLFDHRATCRDDAEGTIYPAMEEITSKFFAAHELAVDVLQSANDTLFFAENPNEAMRAKFATVGSMHGFYVGGHVMMHMGQLSAWRRMLGMGPA